MGGWAGGVKVYEAYELKKKKRKITLSFTPPEKDFLYIFMKSLLHRKKKNAPLFTTCVIQGFGYRV